MSDRYQMIKSPGVGFDAQVGWLYEKIRKLKTGKIKLRAVETPDGPIETMYFELDVPEDIFDTCFEAYVPEAPLPSPGEVTREMLIELCEKGVALETNWHNRDSSSATRQLGEAWALLKAGCDFSIEKVDAQTITGTIYYEGFDRFEMGRVEDNNERWSDGVEKDEDYFYIPTQRRLDRVGEGKDWYC